MYVCAGKKRPQKRAQTNQFNIVSPNIVPPLITTAVAVLRGQPEKPYPWARRVFAPSFSFPIPVPGTLASCLVGKEKRILKTKQHNAHTLAPHMLAHAMTTPSKNRMERNMKTISNSNAPKRAE